MVQIIQSQPTKRQSAFMDSVGQFANNFGNAYMEGQKTLRQQALADQDTAIKLNMAGYDVNQDQVAQARQGGLTDLFSKRTKQYEDELAIKRAESAKKSEREDLDRKYKEAMIRNAGGELAFKKQKQQDDLALEREKLAIGPKPAQNEFAAAGYAKRAKMAEKDLKNLPSDVGTGVISDAIQGATLPIWDVPIFPNALKSDQRQSYEQASNNFISAVLRKESGAAISPSERQAEFEKYFPQPGDSSNVIAQKERSRAQAIANLEAEGSSAMNRVATIDVPVTKKDKISLKPLDGQASAGQGKPPTITLEKINSAGEWLKANPNHPRAKEVQAEYEKLRGF